MCFFVCNHEKNLVPWTWLDSLLKCTKVLQRVLKCKNIQTVSSHQTVLVVSLKRKRWKQNWALKFFFDWFCFFTCRCCCHSCLLLSLESSQPPTIKYILFSTTDCSVFVCSRLTLTFDLRMVTQRQLCWIKSQVWNLPRGLTVQHRCRSCRGEDVRSCRTWRTTEQHSSCDVSKTTNPLRHTVNIEYILAGRTLPCAALGGVAAAHNNYHLTAQKTEEQTQTSMKNVFQEVKSL